MQKITKCIIPAAWFWTRFLPVTKAQPKEMLPIVDKPIIQYVVEEAVDSWINNIIIVTWASKRAIEDHFDYNYELTSMLTKQWKNELKNEIKNIADLANFIYIRQKWPYGNGTPILNSKHIIWNESFAVMWWDEFIYASPARLSQMINVYNKYWWMVVSWFRINDKESLKRYGIAEIKHIENNIYEVKNIVEKPDPDKAPSNLWILWAYILPPEIFNALENIEPWKDNEIWLVDGINKLKKAWIPLYACEIQNGKYYDCWNKLEYLKTNIEFALSRKDMWPELKKFLNKILH